jgi:hypothetical protein
MKTNRSLTGLTLTVALFAASAGSAHEGHNKDKAADHSEHAMKCQLVRVTDKDAAWAAKATAEYPTDVCVVSEDKLGADMGKPQDFIYREEGKPDRLVRFCCKDCVEDFNKEPEKYLKAIDDAAAKKAKSGA